MASYRQFAGLNLGNSILYYTSRAASEAGVWNGAASIRLPKYQSLYLYHPDHLGTATYLTDHKGHAYQFFLNLPFGESMAEQRTGSYENQYKFTGQEFDPETGFYYYGARYYHPGISVFLAFDPAFENTWDAYGYVYNNPVRYVDPSGMFAVDLDDWYKDSQGNIRWFDSSESSIIDNDGNSWNHFAKDHSIVANTQIGNGEFSDVYLGTKGQSNYATGYDRAVVKFLQVWNHKLTRLATGDSFSLQFGLNAGSVLGASGQMGLHIIWRGEDAGIFIDPFNTISVSAGLQGGGDTFLYMGKGYFSGSTSDMTLNSTVGTELFVGASASTPLGGLGGEVSVSHDFTSDNRQNRWITTSGGATWGIRGNAGSGGIRFSNTRLGIGFDGRFRHANYLQSK